MGTSNQLGSTDSAMSRSVLSTQINSRQQQWT